MKESGKEKEKRGALLFKGRDLLNVGKAKGNDRSPKKVHCRRRYKRVKFPVSENFCKSQGLNQVAWFQ